MPVLFRSNFVEVLGPELSEVYRRGVDEWYIAHEDLLWVMGGADWVASRSSYRSLPWFLRWFVLPGCAILTLAYLLLVLLWLC